MVAIEVLLLLHTQPAIASLRVVLVPEHSVVVPIIGPGDCSTVTVTVAMHGPHL